MVSSFDKDTKTILYALVHESNFPLTLCFRHKSVNACLTPLASVDHMSVTTVEGILDNGAPNPIQVGFYHRLVDRMFV